MKSLIISLVIVYFGFGILLYAKQRSFIYFPVGNNQSRLDILTFQNEDQVINVAVINQGQSKAILYFGGNAEDVDNNQRDFQALFPSHTVYLVKYRGYGGSSGSPSEAGIYSDALHVFDKLALSHKSISVMGRSLGSAAATFVAANRDIEKLVLITPFDSVQSVAQSQFPLYPMSILLKDKHDSYGRASDIKAPTLVLAAENDRVIRMKHTKKLLEVLDPETAFKVIKEADHNDISAYPDYIETLAAFFQQ